MSDVHERKCNGTFAIVISMEATYCCANEKEQTYILFDSMVNLFWGYKEKLQNRDEIAEKNKIYYMCAIYSKRANIIARRHRIIELKEKTVRVNKYAWIKGFRHPRRSGFWIKNYQLPVRLEEAADYELMRARLMFRRRLPHWINCIKCATHLRN